MFMQSYNGQLEICKMNSAKSTVEPTKECFDNDFAAIAGMDVDVADFMKGDGKPPPVPAYTRKHRRHHQSRLSNDYLLTPDITNDLLDDLPFCPKSKPMMQDLTPFQARTSTPFENSSLELFNIKSQAFHLDVVASLSKISLDKSRDSGRWSLGSGRWSFGSGRQSLDSGRWSLDTQEAEEFRNHCQTPLPRIALEKTFDEAIEDMEADSAYETQCFPQDTEETGSVLEKSTMLLSPIDEVIPETPKAAFQRVLKQFTPVEPDRLIGRYMGREHVDIISELSVRNMSSVLTLVFENLDDEDLCRSICVSNSWKETFAIDKSANLRRIQAVEKDRLRKIERQKENITVRRSPRKKRGITQSTALGDVQRSVDDIGSRKVITRQSLQLLWKGEASKLRTDEELRKCPMCQSPSKTLPAQERAQCTQCAYDFCTNCQCAFHGASNCSITVRKKSKTDQNVGSRKSKKNLKRL